MLSGPMMPCASSSSLRIHLGCQRRTWRWSPVGSTALPDHSTYSAPCKSILSFSQRLLLLMLARNRKVLTAFNRELGKSGLLHQTVETHVATITDFASTLLLASISPRGLLDLTSADIQSYLSEKSGKQL